MGFQDREYMQGGGKPPMHFQLPKLEPIYWFMIIILFCSLLKINADPLFNVSFESLKNSRVWALFFSLFAVGGKSYDLLFSLLSQGLILYFFGRKIIEIYGFKNFLFVYCLGAYAAVVGYVVSILLSGVPLGQLSVELVLAKMGAYSVFMLYAFRYPKQIILLFFILPIQIRFIAGFIVLVELSTIVSNNVTVEVIAVSVGTVFSMGIGLLLGWKFITLDKVGRFFKGIFRSEVKLANGLRFEEASTDQIKSEVDRLLGKVSDEGLSSLTEKEKAFLKKSSNRY